MRKTGFTLAEVLITLAIIGVIATMTLPALMTNTAEQQAKTGLKKGINTLTEAAQMNQAIAGFDYGSVTEASTSDAESQSLYGIMAKRTSMDFAKSKKITDTALGAAGTSNYAVFFRDGSALMFPEDTKIEADSAALQDDGLPYGLAAIYDTNGTKGPNIVSNCSGVALGISGETKDNTDADAAAACTTQKRVIKDQFGVRLRGGYAVPNGAAARWAYDN